MTENSNLRAPAQIAWRPLHPWLAPFPIVCFAGTLVTDIAYWCTAQMMWADFSAWLLAVGMITGVLAAIASLIDVLGHREIRARRPAWRHLVGIVVVLALALLNNFIHTRDAWTSVVPFGLILSVIVVLLLPVTGWLGWSKVYRRHDVGVIG